MDTKKMYYHQGIENDVAGFTNQGYVWRRQSKCKFPRDGIYASMGRPIKAGHKPHRGNNERIE